MLIQSHVARARLLVIAVPDSVAARRMIDTALALRPDMKTVVRSHSDAETALLQALPGVRVFRGEHELALGMSRCVEERLRAGGAGN